MVNEKTFMERKLRKIMADLLEMEESEITHDTSIDNVDSWDSLKHIQLVLGLEEQFEMALLSMDEIVEMTSFAKIKHILKEKGIEI